MLQAVALSCSRGERRLFLDLNVKVEPGKLLAVVGENGSGKTSLLRIFSSLLPPEQGSVLWEGQDIYQMKELYSAQLTYIGHLNGIKEDLTPLENLMSSMSLAGEPCSRTGAQEALEAIGLKRTKVRGRPSRRLQSRDKNSFHAPLSPDTAGAMSYLGFSPALGPDTHPCSHCPGVDSVI